MKILLLAGGGSNEKEVSKRSGDNIEKALRKTGYSVLRADPADRDFNLQELSKKVDIVFPILHGAGGEDGTIQAVLEKIGIPFLGSSSKVAELAFNKVRYKQLLLKHNILTPKWKTVTKDGLSESDLARAPFVLKPIEGGSSFDTYIIHDPLSQTLNFDESFNKYGSMLLEELIDGQEITVGVLAGQALPVILIIPPAGQEFDYENKYNGKTQEITNPANIPKEVQRRAQELALTVHNLIGCRHMSRTDIIMTAGRELYVLETNTIPGLTEQSLLPKAAAASGITLEELVKKMVELSL